MASSQDTRKQDKNKEAEQAKEQYAKEKATGFLIWMMTGGFIYVLFKTVDKAYDYYLNTTSNTN